MSGLAQGAKDVAKIGMSPFTIPLDTGRNLAKGEGLGQSIGKATKKQLLEPVGNITGGIGEGMADPLPNIAEADPQALASEDARKRAAAKRQAEIDILTDRPGRGGTLSPDTYNYRT